MTSQTDYTSCWLVFSADILSFLFHIKLYKCTRSLRASLGIFITHFFTKNNLSCWAFKMKAQKECDCGLDIWLQFIKQIRTKVHYWHRRKWTNFTAYKIRLEDKNIFFLFSITRARYWIVWRHALKFMSICWTH